MKNGGSCKEDIKLIHKWIEKIKNRRFIAENVA